LEGNRLAVPEGRGVSVKVSVDGTEIVWVALDATVFVAGANDVFVGGLVSTNVGGIGVVEANEQAKEARIHKNEKISFRLIRQVNSPRRII
jgi:hypothetical protein